MQLFDANLLIALDALLDSGSVTRAAERMEVSVAAMSRTLTRIRKLMSDPILVQAGRGLVPTSKALEIRARVHALAEEARSLINLSATSLGDVERTFTIHIEESHIGIFAISITKAVRAKVPGITLRFTTQGEEHIGPLREGMIDLLIGNIKLRGPEVKIQGLFSDKFVGIVRPGHVLSRIKVTAKRYAEQEHISASRRGLQWGPIDDALGKLGLKRRIALVVPSFTTAMASVAISDMVSAVPEHLMGPAVTLYGLYVFPLPVSPPPVHVSQAWHPRFDADPMHRLVRECVLQVCKSTPKHRAVSAQS